MRKLGEWLDEAQQVSRFLQRCLSDRRRAFRGRHVRGDEPGLPAELGGLYTEAASAGVQRLFGDIFQLNNVQVEAYGNVLTGMAFFHGMASEDLTMEELDFKDRDYETLITVRARK